jgi:hypothetical protein
LMKIGIELAASYFEEAKQKIAVPLKTR